MFCVYLFVCNIFYFFVLFGELTSAQQTSNYDDLFSTYFANLFPFLFTQRDYKRLKWFR